MIYKIYVTDSLYCMQREKAVVERFYDILMRKRNKKPMKSGAEIARDVINNAGLKVV